MEKEKAFEDLNLINKVLQMTHRRVDPHMFHLIIWGLIVLVWYPLLNYLTLTNQFYYIPATMAFFLGGGGIASFIFSMRTVARPRIKAGNVRFSLKIGAIAWYFTGLGVVISILIPKLYPGSYQLLYPIWGGIYALMLFTWGIFYSIEFLWCSFLPLLGTIASLVWLQYAGFILGPTMGIGVLIPGVIAELRVARMRKEILSEELSSV